MLDVLYLKGGLNPLVKSGGGVNGSHAVLNVDALMEQTNNLNNVGILCVEARQSHTLGDST